MEWHGYGGTSQSPGEFRNTDFVCLLSVDKCRRAEESFLVADPNFFRRKDPHSQGFCSKDVFLEQVGGEVRGDQFPSSVLVE